MVEDVSTDPEGFSRIPGMDPAAPWLFGPARADFLPQGDATPIPFLLTLEDAAAVAAFEALPPIDELNIERTNGAFRIAYSGRPIAPGEAFLAVASERWFTRLIDSTDERVAAFGRARKSIAFGTPVPVLPEQRAGLLDFLPYVLPDPPEGLRLPKGSVVIAVIDDGIAFAHERFRDKTGGTRIYSHLDMNGLPGTERFKPDIDALLGQAAGEGAGEDGLYLASGLYDFAQEGVKSAARRVAHGTHVLDLAAGAEPDADVQDRPIIAVTLPAWVLADTLGRFLGPYVAEAIRYILDRAVRFGGPYVKVVINGSVGYIAGPHDGSDPLEQQIDALVAADRPCVRVVLPAGNAQLSRCHLEVALDAPGSTEVRWCVPPDDRTMSNVQIWMPPGLAGDGFAVHLTAPDGLITASQSETPGAEALTDADGVEIGTVRYTAPGAGGRGRFDIWIMPTARPEPSALAVAPAGAWTLTLRVTAARADSAHAWIQRDDTLYGYPLGGRQSYFEHEGHVRFDLVSGAELAEDPTGQVSPVTRRSLLNGIASGRRVLVAGGAPEEGGAVVSYSAGGPTTPAEPQDRRKPDAVLPSDGSRALGGVLAAGSRSASVVALDGTSVAAPQLARIVADRLAAGHRADRDDIRDRFAPDPARPERAGWGQFARADARPVDRKAPR
jgi:hypothetical protein